MSDVLRKPTAVLTDEASPRPAAPEPTTAAQLAAVAAAEAIAAEAAAGIAAEAAAVAAEVVAAASLAAAKATAKANRTAAEAAAEIVTVAEAVAEAVDEAASAAAVVASAAVDYTGRPAVAHIAEAARVADGVVHAASAAAAKSATRAHLAATATADEVAVEAAAVAADVVTAAAAAAAKVIAAGDAAAKLVLATAAAITTPIPRQRGLGGHISREHRSEGSSLDEVVHTEWASVLADPVMPRAWAPSAPLETVVSVVAPAEQGLWRDISLAGRMRAALRASEATFEATFRSAPTAMLIATVEDGQPARFSQVNQAMTELTGWASSHLLGFGFTDLVHPEHRTLEEALNRPSDGKIAQPVERMRRWVHADGNAMWVRIRMAELATSTARKAELVCQVEDVTAQLAADASFSSGEARFRLAFSDALQPAVLMGLTGHCPGRVLAVNPAACRFFGRNEVEMSWLDLESLTDPAERPAVVALLDRSASGAVTLHEGTYRYQSASGCPSHVQISAYVVDGPNGLPAYLLAYLRDDTEAPAEQPFLFDTAWARALDL